MSNKRIWATMDPYIEGGAILGRKVANTNFLITLLNEHPYDEYHFFLANKGQILFQDNWLKENFSELYASGCFKIYTQLDLPEAIRSVGYHCFHLSDCIEHHVSLARLRNFYAHEIFPITSVTHSLSYKRFMPAYLSHMWAGTSSRDSIVATSTSAVSMLEATFSHLAEQYKLDSTYIPPSLVKIPLGVSIPESHLHSQQTIDSVLSKTGLNQEVKRPLILLCLSRISAYSKMDILPVLAACKRAEEFGLSLDSFCIILAGHPDQGEALPEALRNKAQSMGIRLIPFLQPTDEERDALYALADIFLSPSDNIQETFGITAIEAGAVGVPVIASDFDGYQDTVIHEKTGLLVPVIGFGATPETNVLSSLWYDNQYHLKLAQQVAVDVPALGKAIAQLACNPNLRESLGETARQHVSSTFAWSTILQQYTKLWDTLATKPLEETEIKRLRHSVHPMEMNFSQSFRGHFKKVLSEETLQNIVIQRTQEGSNVYAKREVLLSYKGLEYMVDSNLLLFLLFNCRRPQKASIVVEILNSFFTEQSMNKDMAQERIHFHILWALKHDLIAIIE